MDPSCRPDGCPTPRLDRAHEVVTEDGELVRVPIRCWRNSCPYCRRLNVQLTAARMGLNQGLTDRPVTHAVLTTTRDWLSEQELRDTWKEFARRVRKHVCAEARYAWFREWTEGRSDGVRRTHYHSTWALDGDDQAAAVAEISRELLTERANAYSVHGHGWARVWDAGGLTRYIAGLVGHHLKASQAPPPGWSGRRFGTSRGFYGIPVDELDRQARELVRDERLTHRLERALIEELDPPDGLPAEILDDVLTPLLDAALERARSRPPARVVRLPIGWAW